LITADADARQQKTRPARQNQSAAALKFTTSSPAGTSCVQGQDHTIQRRLGLVQAIPGSGLAAQASIGWKR
jgi:hypothetical protein